MLRLTYLSAVSVELGRRLIKCGPSGSVQLRDASVGGSRSRKRPFVKRDHSRFTTPTGKVAKEARQFGARPCPGGYNVITRATVPLWVSSRDSQMLPLRSTTKARATPIGTARCASPWSAWKIEPGVSLWTFSIPLSRTCISKLPSRTTNTSGPSFTCQMYG